MRLMRLGVRALFDEPIIGLSEGLAAVDSVRKAEVEALAEEILQGPAVDVTVGEAHS